MGGLCGVSQKQTESEIVHRNSRHRQDNTQNNVTLGKKHEEKSSNKFNDMEEYADGKLIGEGVKQLPAYKCNMPYDQLEKIRSEFWKTKQFPLWSTLKTCCEADHLTAAQILEAEDLACVEGNLRCVVSLRFPDLIFNIPNFCICDPVYEKDFKETNNIVSREEQITVVICRVFDNKENEVKVPSTTITGRDLKILFAEKCPNNTLDKYRLRLLYKGQEVKDEHPLYFHNICNKARIQISIAEL